MLFQVQISYLSHKAFFCLNILLEFTESFRKCRRLRICVAEENSLRVHQIEGALVEEGKSISPFLLAKM